MNKVFTTILDRLAERLTILSARFLSSRVEGFQAEIQADQQSRLENLARQYESEGKTEIAATLRERAAKLVSTDPAADAVETLRCLAEPGLSPGESAVRHGEPPALPDFTSAPRRAPTTRRKPASGSTAPDAEIPS